MVEMPENDDDIRCLVSQSMLQYIEYSAVDGTEFKQENLRQYDRHNISMVFVVRFIITPCPEKVSQISFTITVKNMDKFPSYLACSISDKRLTARQKC